MFSYYSYVSAAELKQIPVGLATRKNRLSILRTVAFICIVSLVVKATLLIYLTDTVINTQLLSVLIWMFLFYFALEIIPMVIILSYYHVDPNYNDTGLLLSTNASNLHHNNVVLNIPNTLQNESNLNHHNYSRDDFYDDSSEITPLNHDTDDRNLHTVVSRLSRES